MTRANVTGTHLKEVTLFINVHLKRSDCLVAASGLVFVNRDRLFSVTEQLFIPFSGFLGYVQTTLPGEQLNPDCFLRPALLEGYFEYLQVRKKRNKFYAGSWLGGFLFQ